MTPKAFILPAEVRDAILNYLGNKPYREVATGFQALLDLKPMPVPDESRELDEPSDQASLGGLEHEP